MGQERVKGETATKVEIVLGVLFVLGALSSLGQGHLYSSQAVFSTVRNVVSWRLSFGSRN